MITANLKDEVQRAIESEWPGFEQNHPRLAAIIDQNLLAEQAAASIVDDPECQQALQDSTATGLPPEAAPEAIARFVRTHIHTLAA